MCRLLGEVARMRAAVDIGTWSSFAVLDLLLALGPCRSARNQPKPILR